MTSVQLYVLVRMLVIPVALASAAVVIARLVSGERLRSALLATGAAAGVVAANVGLAGVPPLPPIDSLGWVPLAALAAMVVLVAVETVAGGRTWPVVLALVGLALAAVYLVGRPTWSRMDAAPAWAWIGLVALSIGAVGGALLWASTRLPAASLGLALVAITAGASVTMLLCHSALLAMILGGIAATAGALTAGGLALKVGVRGRAALAVLTIAVAGLVLYGRLYAEVPRSAAALLAASALILAPIAALPRRRVRAIVAPLAALLLALAAVAVAHRAGAALYGSAVLAPTARGPRG
jgi:hypothetical protein